MPARRGPDAPASGSAALPNEPQHDPTPPRFAPGGHRTTSRRLASAVVALALGLGCAELGTQALLASSWGTARLERAAWNVAARRGWMAARGTVAEAVAPVEIDPRLGWRLKGGTFPMAVGEATIDAQGRRAGVPGSPGGRPVVVLGDSFAFGWDVADDATFTAGLARRRADLAPEVRAVPGYGLQQVALQLEALPPRPGGIDLVTLVSVTAERTIDPFHVFVRPLVAAERGEREPSPIPTPEAVVAAARWRPALADLIEAVAWAAWRERRSTDDLVTARTRALLGRLAEAAAGRGEALAILRLPTPAADDDAGWLRLDADRLAAWTAEVCARPHVRCVDAVDGLTRLVGRTPLLVGSHLSPAAHEVVADALAAGLPEAGDPGVAPPAPGDAAAR